MKSIFNSEFGISDQMEQAFEDAIPKEEMLRKNSVGYTKIDSNNITLLDEVKAFDALLGVNSLDQNIFQRVIPYKEKK